MPFGLKCAPEMFQKAMERSPGIDTVNPFQDDLLVTGSDVFHHDQKLRQTMAAVEKANLKLNKDKLQVGLTEVKYLGHVIGKDGIKPDPHKIAAITSMAPPQSKQELHRFLGMVTYLARFMPHFSEETRVLRGLLRADVPWIWDSQSQQYFDRLKMLLTQSPVLTFYDQEKELTLQVDASSYGIGAVLLHDSKPVAYASATLNPAQCNYAQIEKEMLAVVYGLEHFHYYTYGRKVDVQTDHKPLLGVVKKPMEKVSPRLQRMMLRLQRYDMDLVYVPGKQIAPADTLSRAPLVEGSVNTTDVQSCSIATCLLATISDLKLQQLRQDTAADSTLQKLKHVIHSGWPEQKCHLEPALKPYWDGRDELHIVDELICRGQRLVIPEARRKDIIAIIHETHRGIVACKSRAREAVYWPGMASDLEEVIKKCQNCQQHQRNNIREPLLPRELPELPWQQIGLDFLKLGEIEYLLVIDYYSKFIEVQALTKKTAEAIMPRLKAIFARFGVPQVMVSDTGPPFDSKTFMDFMQQYDIQWKPSSPHHARSNGQVERSVQTLKHQLTKAVVDKKDLSDVLLVSRATPLENCSHSPAELLMGRKIRTRLPILPSLLRPSWKDIHPPKSSIREEQIGQHAKPLQQLRLNQQVWWHDGLHKRQWKSGVIIAVGPAPRTYKVRGANGRVYTRNRFYLRPHYLHDGVSSVERHLPKCTTTAEDLFSNRKTVDIARCPPARSPPANQRLSQGANSIFGRRGRLIRPPIRFQDYVK